MAQNLGSIFPSLGSALGTGMAQPLNETLDMLAQDKLMQLQEASQARMMGKQAAMQQAAAQAERQRFQQNLIPIVGEQGANFLSNLSPLERKAAFQNIGALRQLSGMDQLQSATGQQTDQPNAGLQSLAQGTQGVPAAQGSTTPGSMTQGQPAQAMSAPRSNANVLLEDIFTSPAEKRQREMLKLSQKKVSNQEEQFKKTLGLKKEQLGERQAKTGREFLQPFLERADASENNIRDYNSLLSLYRKGDVRSGNVHQLLSKFGLEGLGRNVSTEMVAKLSARLGQNAASAFGTGRLTNFLESTFQQSLPSLANSPQGAIAIAEINKITDEANLIKRDLASQVVKENKGLVPVDAAIQVSQRARPKLAELEKRALAIAQSSVSGSALNELPDPKTSKITSVWDSKMGKYMDFDVKEKKWKIRT